MIPATVTEEIEEKQWFDNEQGGRSSRVMKKTFEHPLSATVTVYRLVGGTPRVFATSARWSEYYPDPGDEGYVWRKKPFNATLGRPRSRRRSANAS